MNVKNMVDAWRKAEYDLGIAVNSNFILKLSTGIKHFVFIPDFGGVNGTIVTSSLDTEDFNELRDLGFFCSALGEHYLTYDRTLFIDTLNDWGFFGEANKRPNWLTGQSWSA
jgi:hypothetical protein